MAEDFALPHAKRRKLELQASPPTNGSKLFAPFRTLGLVSPTPVPFTAVPLGKTTFQITTSIGQALQTYDLSRGLNLVFLSRPQCPETISATCAYRDKVYIAWGNERAPNGRGVWVAKRGRIVAELACEGTVEQEIRKILVFGSWIVGCGPKAIEVWRSDTYEHYTTISPSPTSENVALTDSACTLPTFLNKLFIGRGNGNVDIYNVSTGKFVYTLPSFAQSKSGPVTAIAPAPAIGLLSIAYADGSLTIVDVETEQIVVEARQPKSITSITFRSDGAGAGEDGRAEGIMATASLDGGDITFWDLNRKGKIAGVLRGAHEILSSNTNSGITGIDFLPGQPVIVSSGLDNSLKSWIFDAVPFTSIPRILHSRSGHAAPVTRLKFLPAASDGSDAAGKWLLSAGQDRSLWGFSLRKDGQSTEISQGHVTRKAKKQGKLTDDLSSVDSFKCPPITAIVCSLNRDGGMGGVGGPVWTNPDARNAEEAGVTGWESVVTAHQDDIYARTWFWGRKKAGRWAFPTGDRKPVTSIAITGCGTFALVGSAGGSIDMFNLQSGIHRQRYPPKLKPSQAKTLKIQELAGAEAAFRHPGHRNTITGIVVDSLNRTVVSTGLDGQAIFWDFTSGQVLDRMQFDSASAMQIQYNSVSGLVSMSCDDLCIRILDIETKKIVRELWGCTGQIYDHCFSHDGRWIVACSMDSVIRVFDLATGHLIDAFKTATCTSVAFSSTGEFLATAHAGSIGINIWNNKALLARVPLRQVDEERELVDLTRQDLFHASSQLAIEEQQDDEIENQLEASGISKLDQLDDSLLTLSLVPQTRWQTLLNLETIRQRNKPIQPPEKPKAAPFFLGSAFVNGDRPLDAALPTQSTDTEATEYERSRITHLASLESGRSGLSTELQVLASQQSEDLTPLIDYMMSLSPSAADLEIRSLSMDEMAPFVAALTARLRQRRDFELVNTWMSVFLRIHGEFVTGIDDVKGEVSEFQRVMATEQARLSQSVGWTRGVVEYLRSAR